MTNVTADHKLFKIKASRCALQVGDRLTAETFLGHDAHTGEPVRAGCAGQVRAVSFSGAEYALLVLVEVKASATENSLQAEPVCFKVDANIGCLVGRKDNSLGAFDTPLCCLLVVHVECSHPTLALAVPVIVELETDRCLAWLR